MRVISDRIQTESLRRSPTKETGGYLFDTLLLADPRRDAMRGFFAPLVPARLTEAYRDVMPEE